MTCYDCESDGTRSVVAICSECGAAICSEHAVEGTLVQFAVTATSWRTPLEPPQRRIRCRACALAVAAKAEVSLSVWSAG